MSRYEVTERLEPGWEEAFQRSRPNSADPTIVRMILDGSPPRAFAAVAGDAAVIIPSSWRSPAATERRLAGARVDLDPT